MRSIATNTIITTITRVINLGIALVLIGLLTRYLGTTGYGNYATILAYLGIFIPLADLGLYSYLLREIGKRKGEQEANLVSSILSLRLTALLVILPIAVIIALFFPYAPQVRIGIGLAAFSSLFLSLSQVTMPVFQKNLTMGPVALAEFLGRLVQLGLFAFFIFIQAPLLLFILGLVIAALTTFLIQVAFVRKITGLRLLLPSKKWLGIIKDALPIGIGIIFITIYFKIDTVMLSVMQNETAVGIYSLAYKVLESTIFFPAAFIGLLMPLLAKALSKNTKGFRLLMQRGFNLLSVTGVPTAFAIIFAAPQIAMLLGGKEFIASSLVLMVLGIAIFLIFLGHLYSAGVITLEKQKTAMYIYISGAVVNFGLNIYIIPKYSYLGAAWTTVITELLITISLALIVYNTSHYLPRIDALTKAFAASVPMGLFLITFSYLPLAILLLSAGLIYLAAILLLRGLQHEDFKLLFARK